VILMPAAMGLLGEWNWYLPRFLGWLPTLSVEGGRTPGVPRPAPTSLAVLRVHSEQRKRR
jgi:putative drug exporter of the RND superfamily